MKKILIIASILCFTSGAHARGSTITLQIIMDDSGVLLDSEVGDKYKHEKLLPHIKLLVRRREFAHAHIDVISTSRARTIWSGSPLDLKRKPRRALNLVNSIKATPESCNNLPGAFDELTSNLKALKRQGFKSAHVIVFSSLIHTPRPCDATTEISLPQSPPVNGNINGALISSELVSSISFYWVAHLQKRIWEEFLEPTFNWASLNNVPMTLLDVERSKYSLQQGLNFGGRK